MAKQAGVVAGVVNQVAEPAQVSVPAAPNTAPAAVPNAPNDMDPPSPKKVNWKWNSARELAAVKAYRVHMADPEDLTQEMRWQKIRVDLGSGEPTKTKPSLSSLKDKMTEIKAEVAANDKKKESGGVIEDESSAVVEMRLALAEVKALDQLDPAQRKKAADQKKVAQGQRIMAAEGLRTRTGSETVRASLDLVDDDLMDLDASDTSGKESSTEGSKKRKRAGSTNDELSLIFEKRNERQAEEAKQKAEATRLKFVAAAEQKAADRASRAELERERIASVERIEIERARLQSQSQAEMFKFFGQFMAAAQGQPRGPAQ
jgi:hypothetical protein